MKFAFLAGDKQKKALPKYTSTVDFPGQIELCERVLDNLVEVKNCGASVEVLLLRDDLTSTARTFLVRYLALEGFIPDRYQFYSGDSDCAALNVKWVIFGPCARMNHKLSRQATRMLNRVSHGRLVAFGLLLAGVITVWLKSH